MRRSGVSRGLDQAPAAAMDHNDDDTDYMTHSNSVVSVLDEPEGLVNDVSSLVEKFVTDLKRGKMAVDSRESLSTAAAVEVAELMANIVRLFQENEEDRKGQTIQLLRLNFPAQEVATMQVRRLLKLIAVTGDALLRSQFSTLLLMNVTRRVLSIIRDAAANNRASKKELEEEAKELLNKEGSEDDEEDDEEDDDLKPSSSRATTTAPSTSTTRGGGGGGLGTNAGPGHVPAMRPAATMSTLRSTRTVRFADMKDPNIGGAGGGGGRAGLAASTGEFTSSVGSPLLRRTASIVAMEIPGQQMLKRAPSKREESLEAQEGTEFPVRASAFYQDALDGIEELKKELESMTEELCRRAPRQLHSSDTVITIGSSNTTRRYLLEAAKAGHTFRVIILEGAPSNTASSLSRDLASALSEKGVAVQVLPDSSAFAVMSICTKVLVGAESVLANGGMLAPIGTHVVCVAARHFAVPVLVSTVTLKMSPYYPSDQLCTRLVRIARSGAQEMPWSTYGSPEAVLALPGSLSVEDGGKGFTVHAPVTEYVPPELITLYATNEGEFVPSQIHRIVRANYSDAD